MRHLSDWIKAVIFNGVPLVGESMKVRVGGAEIELVRGDITQQETDAIVNAANPTLLGGRGVDGAIHRAGGPVILEECKKIGGCRTGEARMTTGGNLKALHVIHTVGPVYQDGEHGEANALASAYRNSLVLARKHNLTSVAFPSISTGAYRFPLDAAAEIAIGTVRDFLSSFPGLKLVRFVLFGKDAFRVFSRVLERMEDLD